MESAPCESKFDVAARRDADVAIHPKAAAGEGEAVMGEASAAVALKMPATPPRGAGPVNLAELVRGIAAELNGRPHVPLEKRSVIQDLMERYDPSSGDWKRFEMYDRFKYTRNLVATDHKTFTLLLLCWNTSQARCAGRGVGLLGATCRHPRIAPATPAPSALPANPRPESPTAPFTTIRAMDAGCAS